MKKIFLYVLPLLSLLASCSKDEESKPASALNDSITMGAGYANDVYYSFSNGVVKTQNRKDWDIAFSTDPRSSSVIINAAAGVVLYQVAGDTTVWNSVDTTGIAHWTPLNNSDTTWFNSAFEANATGHPDYGWGVYNSLSHDVIGKAVFVLKTPSGDFKKIWIKNRLAATNSYDFVFAALDGSDEQLVAVPCADYATKNFVYYSISGKQLIDREPEKSSWDLLFTKYIDRSMNYPVTGVLLNNKVSAIKVAGESTSVDTYTGSFSTSISTIGADWKEFNMDTYAYSIVADRKYFVKTIAGSVYKLNFTSFDMTVGKAVFEKKKIK